MGTITTLVVRWLGCLTGGLIDDNCSLQFIAAPKVVRDYAKVFAQLDMDRILILDHLMSHFAILSSEVRRLV